MAYVFVAATVLLGVYGQLILKWRVGMLELPEGERVQNLLRFVFDPWVMSAFLGAAIAAVAWVAALSKLDLSEAYPFISASFVLVLVSSAIFFDDSLTVLKVVGASLIVLGLIIGSQG